MARFEEYKLRMAGFWKQYRKSKMGITGIGIIIFFLVVALTAPVLSPWPEPVIIGLGPRLSAPVWLLPLNPGGFSEIYPLSNSRFDSTVKDDSWVYNQSCQGEIYTVVGNPSFDENASGWLYSESGGGTAITDGSWTNTTGASPGSGPGCFEVVFNDTSTMNGYPTTDVYVGYDFLFNASRFPVGLVSRHPSAVTVSYSISVIMKGTSQNIADMIFALEVKNSTGPAVVLYTRQYYYPTTTVSWSTYSYSMTSQQINDTFVNTGTDTMTVRMHYTFRDATVPPTPDITVRVDDVQCSIRAAYANTTGGTLIQGAWNGSEGNPADGEPGCYEIAISDNSTTTAFDDPSGWIQSSFTWNVYNAPTEAYIKYVYKVVVEGDPGDAYVNIIQEAYVVNTGQTVQVLRGKDINSNTTWAPSPNKDFDAFMRADIFGPRGAVLIRCRVEVIDPTPGDTFTVKVYLDDVELQLLGGYYGWLGGGSYGEDLMSQLLWGSRIAILVGLLAAFISTFVGLIVGLVSGFFGGLVDEILMRITDFFLVIPGLPLMIVLAAILGTSWVNIVLVIALLGWTGTARLVRSQVLAERQKAYVEAARAIGASDLYIIFRHILPNVTPLLFAQITLGVAGSILSEAALSFLNLTSPYDVSWGRMLMQASTSGAYSRGCWWYVFFPGLCIVLLALSFTLVGYAVDEILNPRLRIRKE
jgi:peptide/nickel transport system permease protein